MKKSNCLLNLGMFLAVVCGSAQATAPFEGEVVLKWTQPYPLTMHCFIKGKHMRSDMEGMQGPMKIVDLDKLEAYDFFNNTYKVTALPKPPEGKSFPGGMVKSGKKKIIAGQNCEEWVDKSKYSTTRIWVAPGVSFSAHPWSGSPNGQTMFEYFQSNNLFPLALTYEGSDGKVSSAAEATLFQKKKLEISFFAMPPGVKKIEK